MITAIGLLGCGGDSMAQVDASMTGDAPDGDAPTGDAPACGAAGPAEMTCGTACVDTSSDPQHCGGCAMTCSGLTTSCADGMCVTPLTTTWEHHFGGGAFGYQLEAVAVDGAGNTYVTGMFLTTIDLGGGAITSAGSTDIVVASFAPDGSHRWSKRFGGTMEDQGAGITVTGGKVYVTGEFHDTVNFGGGNKTSTGQSDLFVLVLSSATGAFSTAYTYGTSGSDAGLGVVVDAIGNITVGGFFGPGMVDFGGGHTISGAASDNAFVASITSTGAHRWSRTLAGAASTFNSCQSLTVDGAGNVTTGGEFEGATDFGAGPVSSATNNFDAFIASYTPTGAHRWSRVIGAAQSDTAEAVAASANGDIVVGGSFHSTVNFGSNTLTSSGVIDGWVAILDGGSGVTRFARKLGASSSGAVRDVAADPTGNVIVSATIEGAADFGTGPLAPLGVYDIAIAGFDKTTGAALFAKRYGGTDYEGGQSIAVTAGGAMAVSGYFRGTVDLGLGPIVGGTKDNGFVMMIAR